MARQNQNQPAISGSLAGASVENKEFAGIPDSPIFRNTERAERPIDEKLLNAHVGGMPVRDMPMEAQQRLMYRQTDEGIAEANEGKSEVRAHTTRDEYSKAVEHRRDDIVERGMEPWEATNPMQEVADRHVQPGFKGKYLSPDKVAKDGMRGYRAVVGSNGEPVKLRNMILGEMPIEKVEKRNKFYQDKGAAAVTAVKEQFLKEGGNTAVAD